MNARLKALAAHLGPFVLVGVLCLGAGFFAGRRGPQPAKVTESSHVAETAHVENHETVKAAEKIAEKTDTKTATKRHTVRTAYRKDGTVSSRTETTSGTDTATEKARQTDAAKETVSSEVSDKVRTEDRLKVTEYRRDWRVSALIGAELVNPLTHAGNPLGSVTYGIHAERRIIGPVWGGAWAMGVGPARLWYVGLSLGVEF